jgi:dienelactone hydrolase
MKAKPVATVNYPRASTIMPHVRRHLCRALVLATLATSMWASAAWASVESPHPRGASNREDPTFAVGQRTVTFVDTSRSTPAANGEAAASTRTIQTLVLYPARAKPGGPAVSEAPPARGRQFPVVVFLHGSGTTGEDYRETLEQWAAAGYVVAAPTMPLGGHGVLGGQALAADQSNHPDDVRFVLDELGNELPRALRRSTDLDRVAIIGKSLGAATAMNVAFDPSRADERIRAVVPIAEPTSGEAGVWVDRNLASSNHVPVLFVHGEADEIYPYAASHANFDGAQAPKFLLTLVGTSHAPTLSIDGVGPADDAVVQGTLDFLDRFAGSDKHALTRLHQDTDVPGVTRLEASQ